MSKKVPTDISTVKSFNVAIVGLSGTEREKGVAGVGKSCLINRFVRPNADDYYTDHISILSQSDFAGRVVNNDHFLYWGSATHTSDDGSDVQFHIIEQTEFSDDSSFQSFRIGKTEPYFKRCAALRLQSAEKLAYICKNQLGLEHEFEQKLLPEGRINIDGFICVFDVSEVAHRPVSRQVEHVACILAQLAKTKKPVVLATTKNDEQQRTHVTEAEHLVMRKDLRGSGPIPIVETSAHENVNIELAFMTLAHLIERGASTGKNKPRTMTYAEAARARREVIEVATEAFQGLIRSQVNDYNFRWDASRRRLQNDADFVHYVELCGTVQAEKIFRRHLARLRDDFIRQRQNIHLRRLEILLREILPDLSTIADRSWYSTLLWLKRQPFFDRFFVVIPEGASWKDSGYLETHDERIPIDMLEQLPEAESIFRNHVNVLRVEQRKAELKRQFRQLLEDNRQVGPGKSLAEVAIFFLGRECFTSLSEKEKQEIYDDHQNTLRGVARREFLELLLENAETLAKFEHNQVTNDDIREINERLQNEPRFRALARMEEDRRVILLNHLGFIQRSYTECCPFRDKCVDILVKQVQMTRARRPPLWQRNSQLLLDTQDNRLHFVIVGIENLAEQLSAEIRLQCIEDEYMLDGELFTLEYHTADDVTTFMQTYESVESRPQGCFCVYHSESTLEFICNILEKSQASGDEQLPLRDLPTVIVLGHNPDISEKQLAALREEGQSLADRLQCSFVDIPSSMMVNASRRFHEDQIGLAMHQLVIAIKCRSSVCLRPWHLSTESIEPDIRILMCLMCGDGYNAELPLSPLLNHQFSYITASEDGFVTVTLETFLDVSKRKIEVTVTSYHSASQLKDCMFHGFLLVYWAKRKASLATLRAFASKLSMAPTLILAVAETGANIFFTNEQLQALLTEGNSFADAQHAAFMTTCANFHQQTASYTTFFKDCWELKSNTEAAYSSGLSGGNAVAGVGTMRVGAGTTLQRLPDPAVQERMRHRPPAALPKSLAPSTMAKSSTSNSADDSDTPYIDPNESSDQRPSSASSRPAGRAVGGRTALGGLVVMSETNGTSDLYDEVYSEITGQDTELLIKPQTSRHGAKTRRNVYASYSAQSLASDKKSPSPSKHNLLEKPKAFESGKVMEGCQISHSPTSGSLMKAPLATPDPMDVFGDYAQVKDALEECDLNVPIENNYASVADLLPAGRLHRIRSNVNRKQEGNSADGTDTDSEFSSNDLDRQKDPWVNRRPPVMKKKHSKLRAVNSSLSASPGDDHPLLRSDLLQKACDYSPSDGTDGTADDAENLIATEPAAVVPKIKKKRSVRGSRKKVSEVDPPSTLTDSDAVPSGGGSSSKPVADDDGKELVTWRHRLRLRSDKDSGDSERQSRKDTKKTRSSQEDDRHRSKSKSKLDIARSPGRKSKKDSKGLSVFNRNKDGATLEELARISSTLVPEFVRICVEYIEAEGLMTEGIYRIPGGRGNVDMFMDSFRDDPRFDITRSGISVNTVGTALKQFFSELREPVVPLSLYSDLTDAVNLADRSLRLLTIRGLLRKLEPANYAVLKYIITHLYRVSKMSAVHNMDSKNLAICWWPTLLWPEIQSMDTMYLTTKPLEELVHLLIDQHGFFFNGESEVT